MSFSYYSLYSWYFLINVRVKIHQESRVFHRVFLTICTFQRVHEIYLEAIFIGATTIRDPASKCQHGQVTLASADNNRLELVAPTSFLIDQFQFKRKSISCSGEWSTWECHTCKDNFFNVPRSLGRWRSIEKSRVHVSSNYPIRIYAKTRCYQFFLSFFFFFFFNEYKDSQRKAKSSLTFLLVSIVVRRYMFVEGIKRAFNRILTTMELEWPKENSRNEVHQETSCTTLESL